MIPKFSLSTAISVVTVALGTIAPLAQSAPTIRAITVDDNTITISGSGFGEKEQAAPIMWVFGSDVRLNGKQVDIERNIVANGKVPIKKGAEKSLWTHGGGIKFDGTSRDPSISHTYRAEGNGWVGWPYAYGGSDTPHSEKAFISWRVKPSGDINSYKEMAFSKSDGVFQTGKTPYDMGEKVTLTTRHGRKFSGHMVYVDNTKHHVHLALPGVSKAYLADAKLVGDETGSKMTVAPDDFYRPTTGTKYLRSYETVRKSGTHAVLSTNRWVSVQYNKFGNELRRAFEKRGGAGYGVVDVSKSNDWTLMEAYIDLSGTIGKGYVSANNTGKKWFKDLYIGDSKPDSHGPTISNIGWEAAGGTESIHAALNFGEIYFDKTPQRVVLSSEKKYFKTRDNQEFQYIRVWNDQKIVVEKWLRSLNTNLPVYLYVFDENNNVNDNGICISHCDGSRPPSRTTLNIR